LTRHSLILPDLNSNPLVVLGRIGRPHGVLGQLHVDRAGENLRAFTGKNVQLCPAAGYSMLVDARSATRTILLKSCDPAKGEVSRVTFEGLADRDQAATLTNQLIAVPRSELAELAAAGRKGEPQHLSDLWYFEMIGLTVRDGETATVFARITAVEELGQNTLVTLEPLPEQNLLSRRFELPLEYPHWKNVDVSRNEVTLAEWKPFAEA
jgi:ribosomal 30S subunit maturation factor RimM